MKKPPPLTPDQLAEARIMRNVGKTWTEIGRHFGVDYETVKRRIDPHFAERRRDGLRRIRVEKKQGKKSLRHVAAAGNVSAFRPTEAEFLAAQKLIPPDTRDLTARICGDPLPGRRALDMRGAK